MVVVMGIFSYPFYVLYHNIGATGDMMILTKATVAFDDIFTKPVRPEFFIEDSHVCRRFVDRYNVESRIDKNNIKWN
jgi:hypothetical protein